MPDSERESTSRRAARDFDLLSALNGYPETFSIFQGDEVILRVARKPGQFPFLPSLLIRVMWRTRFTGDLRQRALSRKAMHRARRPVSNVKRVDVRDCVTGAVVFRKNFAGDLPIYEQMPASYKDNGADYACRIPLSTAGWAPGIHECIVRDDRGAVSRGVYVNVKPRRLRDADLLCIFPSFTWQAYNRVGGGSFYSPELGHVRTICTQRPMQHSGDNSIAPALGLVSLFQKQGVKLVCVDSWDLHDGSLPVGDVSVAAILVHDEYWSAPMRAQIDKLLDRGAAVLVLSGNTCWWRVEVDGGNISVRKEPSKRALWRLTGPAEEETFVSSFRFGGYPAGLAKENAKAASGFVSSEELQNAGAMTVTDPGHPLFKGVSLERDMTFGRAVPVVYRELDGIPLLEDGTPSTTGYKAPNVTPHVLATALAFDGKSLRRVGMVVEAKVRNGYVLHMGSIGWARGVWRRNRDVERIVLNAYAHCRAMCGRPAEQAGTAKAHATCDSTT